MTAFTHDQQRRFWRAEHLARARNRNHVMMRGGLWRRVTVDEATERAAVEWCNRRNEAIAERNRETTGVAGLDRMFGKFSPIDGVVVRHRKTGKHYTVRGFATHTETGEILVVYGRDVEANDWVRPAAMFTDGRFEVVGNE